MGNFTVPTRTRRLNILRRPRLITRYQLTRLRHVNGILRTRFVIVRHVWSLSTNKITRRPRRINRLVRRLIVQRRRQFHIFLPHQNRLLRSSRIHSPFTIFCVGIYSYIRIVVRGDFYRKILREFLHSSRGRQGGPRGAPGQERVYEGGHPGEYVYTGDIMFWRYVSGFSPSNV